MIHFTEKLPSSNGKILFKILDDRIGISIFNIIGVYSSKVSF